VKRNNEALLRACADVAVMAAPVGPKAYELAHAIALAIVSDTDFDDVFALASIYESLANLAALDAEHRVERLCAERSAGCARGSLAGPIGDALAIVGRALEGLTADPDGAGGE
jgi:hypothetical protein